VRDILPGKVPGLRATLVSLAPGVAHTEPASVAEDRVFLVLSGAGEFVSSGKHHPVARETIARFPLGRKVWIKATATATTSAPATPPDAQGMSLLILRQTLTPADREDLAANAHAPRAVYLKTFAECAPYAEAIKSAKTVSRTLLPRDIVPRMAIGTVETTGPDKVAPHRHPMLEQYFLGLESNDITVVADGIRVPLKAHELFHIPLGSNHGAEVESGRKLHYVWMDFFQNREGLEWLDGHKPLSPAKQAGARP
jgi:quercetin dioxygenase-like cupin family protein